MNNISIFIFRRDYRLYDNTAFIECYNNSEHILPIFIFTPEQTKENKYFSSNSFQFLINSLNDLDLDLKNKYKSKLYYFYGDNIDILNKINKKINIKDIYFNIDYTPYAIQRDNSIRKFCEDNNILCKTFEDYLLFPIGTITKKDGGYYQKYTPFKNTAIKMNPNKPKNNTFRSNKFIKNVNFDFSYDTSNLHNLYTHNPNLLLNGGRSEALKILKNSQKFSSYKDHRNDLTYQTTHLSAFIKFGCVSIREVYWNFKDKVGLHNGLIEQLLWREFYFYIIYNQPDILTKGNPQHMKFAYIPWKNNKNHFEKWKKGETGFPVVDAGIREMITTGYMHNRARLITASILIKVLQIDWKWGEEYMAKNYMDYDPSVNNGNWQWCSGTGENPQDYWRFFSPWKQAIDYDPNCEYIKKWIPELKDIPNEAILKWNEKYNEFKDQTTYPKPLVEFDAKLREETLEMYRDSFKIFDKKE